MTGAPDFFPGFSRKRLQTSEAEIFLRVGGIGPPLLLLHGYPQSHVMWHRVAGELSRHFTVVAADLRGYGESSCPPTDLQHRAYSKRSMAIDMVEVMSMLGQTRFSVMGHDRGARVAYRMALDHPQSVERLALLDIVTTFDQWQAEDQKSKMRMFHWGFLAQPAPLPESLIRRAPDDWVNGPFRRSSRDKSLAVFDEAALEVYRAVFRDSDHVHATCEDYRAGATCDLADDQADLAAGNMIHAPTLLLRATHGTLSDFPEPVERWRRWCTDLRDGTIDSGHFIAEENPRALLDVTIPFFLGVGETRP